MLEELRKQFDRVVLKHYTKNKRKTIKGTVAALIKGDKIFIGISRCNSKLEKAFLKTRGREVALARALKASKKENNQEENPYSYTTTTVEVSEAIKDHVFKGIPYAICQYDRNGQ